MNFEIFYKFTEDLKIFENTIHIIINGHIVKSIFHCEKKNNGIHNEYLISIM